jgi:glyoxylase I family protein
VSIEITKLAPLLQVYDMPTSVRFYRDVLGFEVVMTDGKPPNDCDWCLLRLHGVELMLNTRYEAGDRPPAPDPARVKAHGDTALFFDCPDVESAHAHLKSRGIAVEEPWITHYGFMNLTLKDPDGYDLVFHWPVEKR